MDFARYITYRQHEAMPMVQLLWQRETDGKKFDSPERKAALDKALRDKIKLIADPSIRSHYGQAIKDMRWELFSNRKPQQRQTSTARRGTYRNQASWQREVKPLASNKSSALGAGAAHEDVLREAVILATVLATPEVLPEFDADLEMLEFRDQEHARMRDAIIRYSMNDDLKDAVLQSMGPAPLEKLFGQSHVAITPSVVKAGDLETARLCLSGEFDKIRTSRGRPIEVAEAEQEITGVADEGLTWRLAQAAAAEERSRKIAGGDDAKPGSQDVDIRQARHSPSS